MNENKLNLAPPWVEFFHKIDELFKEDPDVKVSYDDDSKAITLLVEGAAKAEALTALLPAERTFGSVSVSVKVVPANVPRSTIGLFRDAFNGNPAFSYAVTLDNVFSNPISYVVFAHKIVQYFNDDLSDPHGLESTLYEFIADDIFENRDGVCFSTDTEEFLE